MGSRDRGERDREEGSTSLVLMDLEDRLHDLEKDPYDVEKHPYRLETHSQWHDSSRELEKYSLGLEVGSTELDFQKRS